LLKKRNKAERDGSGPLFARQDADTQVRLQQAATALADLPTTGFTTSSARSCLPSERTN
jgi:hypothetical protein